MNGEARDERPLTGNPSAPDERGELIGIGGQYTVHDIGDGRVVKIPNSLDGSRRFVGGWAPHMADVPNRHMPLIETAYNRSYCVPHCLRLAARYPVLHELFGRPEALPGLCFTQDRLETLRDVIARSTDGEVRSYIDATADIYRLLWRYGIHDPIWFWIVNNGVDAEGRVLYMDFGETMFCAHAVRQKIEEREWEEKQVLVASLSEKNQAYYFSAMKDRLSGDNFEANWMADLEELDRRIIDAPKLSRRPDAIPELAIDILTRAHEEDGYTARQIAPDVLDLFRRYRWDGKSDVESTKDRALQRLYGWSGGGPELQNVIYRAAENCSGSAIQMDDLPRSDRFRDDDA